MKPITLSFLVFAAFAASCSTPTGGSSSAPEAVAASASGTYDRPGFTTRPANGRLWVFAEDSKELQQFQSIGEPTICISRIGAGPNGMTLRAPDAETIDAYLLARPGFATRIVNGRVWVFAAGSKEWQQFLSTGEPTVCVTRIGAGPNGMTVKAPDSAVVDGWLAAL